VLLAGVAAVLLGAGCSTDVVPRAPDLRSEHTSESEGPETNGARERDFLRRFSDDFQMLYARKKPWTHYLLVHLGVRFLRKNGPEKYQNRKETDRGYPGIDTFVRKVQKHGGAWQYLGHLTKTTDLQPGVRKEFRSDRNFQPSLELSLAMQLYTREGFLLSRSEVFRGRLKEPAFREPLLRSLLLLVTAQHFGAALRNTPEENRPFRSFVQDRLKDVLAKWKKQLVPLRKAWNSTFEIPLVSSSTLRYMQQTFTDQLSYEYSFTTGTFQEVEKTLPFQEVYRGTVFELPEKIRSVHTEAIESFVEQRFQSTLRNRVILLVQMIKYQRYRDLTGDDDLSDEQARFYVRTSIDEIAQVLRSR